MKSLLWYVAAGSLGLFFVVSLAAPFLSPYSPREQFREFFYRSPTQLHFQDAEGRWSLRPFIYDYEIGDPAPRYREVSEPLPIYFFVEGNPYQWFGVTFRTHLFGLRDTSKKIFLLGSDALGRDLFSRTLHGMRFSLGVGISAVCLTALMGTFLGALAGYVGGWIDTVLMRIVDLLLSLPGLFLILAVRTLFDLDLSIANFYAVTVLTFALVGCAWVTRVIRGQVLSLKTREYVLAARVAGASHLRILRRHILPFTTNYLIVQTTVLIPAFIVGEITLSFLGVGVQEPHSSLGTLLIDAASVRAMTQFPWLLSPALFIFLIVMAFNLIGDEWKARDKETRGWW